MTDLTGTPPTRHPSFREALRFWLKLGFISFGGPTGQIAIMHTELVERRRWISNDRFLHALNYCMLLPGPEATQLATYIGWLLHRTWGGVVAGVLFFLPAAVLLWVLSYVHVTFGDVPLVGAVFQGLKPAVLAIVAAAVLRIGSKALRSGVMWLVAAAAFVALYFFNVPFPATILGAGLLGFFGGKAWPNQFKAAIPHGPAAGPAAVIDSTSAVPGHSDVSLGRALKVTGVCVTLWALPVVLAGVLLGTGHVLFREGLFFSKAAMVTFGGAYAVLPYVSQQAVEHYGWLGAGEMMDGLALAETTPGPLIMVLQFVGFVGAWNHPGALPPLLAATLGALITTWTTFVPCFLWILLGAPHIERWRGSARLNATLGTVTAAVVGVVLNLAVWFGVNVLRPETGRFDFVAALIALIAFIGLWRWKWNVIAVVAGGGFLGLLRGMMFP